MTAHFKIGCILFLLFVWLSCEHRPFELLENKHYIRIYINDSIPNNTCNFYIDAPEARNFNQPEVMRVLLYDQRSGNLCKDAYLQRCGKDHRGFYLEGEIYAEPGCYHLLAYNFGTECTIIRNEKQFDEIEAYTNPIAEHLYNSNPEIDQGDLQWPVYEPDHLFVVSEENIQIPPTFGVDTIGNQASNYFVAYTLVNSYYIQIEVKGVRWVSQANAFLSGMTGSIKLHNGEKNESDAANIFFEMGISMNPRSTESDSETKTATLFATFNTFGKRSQKDTKMNVTFEFTKTDGKLQQESIILTPMFETDDVKINRWLIIEREIEVLPPKPNNGISPDVEDWEDVNTNVNI